MRAEPEYVARKLNGKVERLMSVEQPMKFELVVKFKTAKQVGVTIDPNLLARAQKLIK
jgi:hypothetical protein